MKEQKSAPCDGSTAWALAAGSGGDLAADRILDTGASKHLVCDESPIEYGVSCANAITLTLPNSDRLEVVVKRFVTLAGEVYGNDIDMRLSEVCLLRDSLGT